MISSTVTDFEGTRYESSIVCFRIAENFSRESNITYGGVIDNKSGEKKYLRVCNLFAIQSEQPVPL